MKRQFFGPQQTLGTVNNENNIHTFILITIGLEIGIKKYVSVDVHFIEFCLKK